MRLRCLVGRHKAPNPYFAVEHDGIWFGECPSCSEQIIMRPGGGWEELPEGKRVIWQQGAPALADRPAYNSRGQPNARPSRVKTAFREVCIRLFVP